MQIFLVYHVPVKLFIIQFTDQHTVECVLQADLEAREAQIQEMVAQTERKEAQIQGQEPIYDDDQEPIYVNSAPLYEVPVASGWVCIHKSLNRDLATPYFTPYNPDK